MRRRDEEAIADSSNGETVELYDGESNPPSQSLIFCIVSLGVPLALNPTDIYHAPDILNIARGTTDPGYSI